MHLYPHQQKIASSRARFKVQRGGRRGGKTVVKTETMLFMALSADTKLSREFINRSVIFIAPTQKQARSIIWEALKSRIGKVGTINESRLEMKLPNELGGYSTIFVGGWENRENYRGMSNVVHIEFDEVDTMRDFFIGWEEIFLPMLRESGGSAGFGGTPKKENPNLRRLEKEAQNNYEWECFHFSSWDNPDFDRVELQKAKDTMDPNAYKQEILAEYVDNAGSLFKYSAVIDVFSNTVTKDGQKYMAVDVAEEGNDKIKFSIWDGLEEFRRETYSNLSSDAVINLIREFAVQYQIPHSNICVDSIGVGYGVASSPLLAGIVGFKSSYTAIRTDLSPVLLPTVHYTNNAPLTTDYRNLRSQCIFTLADLVNNHKIASRVSGAAKEAIIEELPTYQDVSKGDGKRLATPKEDIRDLIGRSPDDSDTWIMRMYFVLRDRMLPDQSEKLANVTQALNRQFNLNQNRQAFNSAK